MAMKKPKVGDVKVNQDALDCLLFTVLMSLKTDFLSLTFLLVRDLAMRYSTAKLKTNDRARINIRLISSLKPLVITATKTNRKLIEIRTSVNCACEYPRRMNM